MGMERRRRLARATESFREMQTHAGGAHDTFPASDQQPLLVMLLRLLQRIRSSFPTEERRLQAIKDAVEGKPKRKPFQPRVTLPWYSLNRLRNMMVVAAVSVLYMYWDSAKMTGRAIERGFRLEKERKAFLKQLDEEDALIEKREQTLASAAKGRKDSLQ